MTVLPTPWPRMDFTFLVSAVRIGIWNVPSPKTMSMPDRSVSSLIMRANSAGPMASSHERPQASPFDSGSTYSVEAPAMCPVG